MIGARTPPALKWLWWRHTWTFQLAHKPLCGRFHRDVLRLGSLRVCRSCAIMYGGFGVMILATFLGGINRFALPGAAALFATLVVVVFSTPMLYPNASRYARDLLRCAAGVLAAQGALLLASSEWPYGLGTIALLSGAWIACHRVERTRRDDVCAGCAERDSGGICSGYRYQTSCLRRYEEDATVWLEEHQVSMRRSFQAVSETSKRHLQVAAEPVHSQASLAKIEGGTGSPWASRLSM